MTSFENQSASSPPTPVYPIPDSQLKELRDGPAIKIFVENGPIQTCIFAISQPLLAYFYLRFRSSLEDVNKVTKDVILMDCAKDATRWIMRWIHSGGQMPLPRKTYPGGPPPTILTLLQRIQVLIYLEIPGPLFTEMLIQLCSLVLKATFLPGDVIHWFYINTSDTLAPALHRSFISIVITTVFNARLILPTICIPAHAASHAQFRKDLMNIMSTSDFISQIYRSQKKVPLQVRQLRYIYNFSLKDSALRRVVANGLVDLIDQGRLLQPDTLKAYYDFARENKDFQRDMLDAIQSLHIREQKVMPNRTFQVTGTEQMSYSLVSRW